MDRSSRQKISKETLDVNYTLEQMDLTDVYRTFCPTAAKIKKPFFSSGPGTFSRIDYVLGHKISLNRKKTGKFTNIWKLNNTLLNNQRVKEEIKREIKKKT